MADWRDLLTKQSPVDYAIPENNGDTESYIRNFEVMNKLVQTGRANGEAEQSAARQRALEREAE